MVFLPNDAADTKLPRRAINCLGPIILFQTYSKLRVWRFWRYVQVFGYSVSGVVLNVKQAGGTTQIPISNLTGNDARIRKWFLLKIVKFATAALRC